MYRNSYSFGSEACPIYALHDIEFGSLVPPCEAVAYPGTEAHFTFQRYSFFQINDLRLQAAGCRNKVSSTNKSFFHDNSNYPFTNTPSKLLTSNYLPYDSFRMAGDEDQSKTVIKNSVDEEVARLTLQHSVVKDAMGGKLLFAPLDLNKPGLRILDSACADGKFIFDYADPFQPFLC